MSTVTVTPVGIAQFIESFHGQSSTAGIEHPSKCAGVLALLDRLDENIFPDSRAYASMREAYARLESHVERHKHNPGAASDIYAQWAKQGISPLRDTWQLMKTLPDSPPVTVNISEAASSVPENQKAVIITALSVEYGAARSHLTKLREVTHPLGT